MANTVVETTYGKLDGLDKGDVLQFRGIPYAAPPVGDRRFRPPAPPDAWTDVREAKTFGPAAPQSSSAIDLLNTRELEMSEDCLTLNVYTPGADDARRPVMVWIHGGAFVTGTGSSPWYNGTTFASKGDVVVVTINYRLGALGFMYLDDIVEDIQDSANLGILDQIAALEWVRDNIAAFGGDPENVTVFGESAGAMSIGTLLGTPAAKDLFHRAVLQSGAVRHMSDRDEASRIAKDLTGHLGLDRLSAATLREIQFEQLIEAQGITFMSYWGKTRGLPLQPVLDGVVLPEHPLQAIENGSTAGKELLAGTTRDEMLLFALLDPKHQTLTEEELVKRATRAFGDAAGAARAIATYRGNRPDATPGEISSAIQTDYVFRSSMNELVDKHQGDAFVYLFEYCSPVMGGKLGSCHALEIPFVFNALDAPGADQFSGPPTAEMRELAFAMNEAWTNFARSGRPQSTLLPEWPPFDDQRRTMVFDIESRVIEDPLGNERLLWLGAARPSR